MDESAQGPLVAKTMPSRGEFDEDAYLKLHPDVSAAIRAGNVGSAWQHYSLHGFAEHRAWVPKPDVLAGVQKDIAPGDEMYRGDGTHYFDAGESALRCIETIRVAAGRPKATINRILDLPCGHGRVMRFLRHAYPAAELTACDLEPEGVAFCGRTFAAIPVLSHADPTRIPLEGPYDLIWCGSLLTHLPRERWESFFRLFYRLLRPGGFLVFTTHGPSCVDDLVTGRHRYGLDDAQIASLLAAYRQKGFGYVDYSAASGYGISLALPANVLAHFVHLSGWQLLGYHEAAWDKRQDVVGVRRV